MDGRCSDHCFHTPSNWYAMRTTDPSMRKWHVVWTCVLIYREDYWLVNLEVISLTPCSGLLFGTTHEGRLPADWLIYRIPHLLIYSLSLEVSDDIPFHVSTEIKNSVVSSVSCDIDCTLLACCINNNCRIKPCIKISITNNYMYKVWRKAIMVQ